MSSALFYGYELFISEQKLEIIEGWMSSKPAKISHIHVMV